LEGGLDDFSIAEILQVIALGRKTGWLAVKTPGGVGAVVFQKGRVLASVDSGSAPLAGANGSAAAQLPAERIRERIVASLDRLARTREGQFRFLVSSRPPRIVAGRDIARETLRAGIEAIDVLLEVVGHQAQELAASARPDGFSVLLVDDEELVRRLLARFLAEGGCRVVEAGDVDSAVTTGVSLGEAGIRFVLVTDLNLPASAGDSFRGGVEVVSRLEGLRLRPPVVMMTENGVSSLNALPMPRAWSVVHKPGLSQRNSEQYEADLRSLAGRMLEEILPSVCRALPA
jgi:CheY-like chemotaxis protein